MKFLGKGYLHWKFLFNLGFKYGVDYAKITVAIKIVRHCFLTSSLFKYSDRVYWLIDIPRENITKNTGKSDLN